MYVLLCVCRSMYVLLLLSICHIFFFSLKMSASRLPAGYLTDSRGEAWSDAGSDVEMQRYPSQPSMGGTSFISGTSRSYISGSRKSVYSTYTTTYTPSQISYVLPVVANAPNPLKKPKDNFGFAFCSLFFNPIFGLVALLLAGKHSTFIIWM